MATITNFEWKALPSSAGTYLVYNSNETNINLQYKVYDVTTRGTELVIFDSLSNNYKLVQELIGRKWFGPLVSDTSLAQDVNINVFETVATGFYTEIQALLQVALAANNLRKVVGNFDNFNLNNSTVEAAYSAMTDALSTFIGLRYNHCSDLNTVYANKACNRTAVTTK